MCYFRNKIYVCSVKRVSQYMSYANKEKRGPPFVTEFMNVGVCKVNLLANGFKINTNEPNLLTNEAKTITNDLHLITNDFHLITNEIEIQYLFYKREIKCIIILQTSTNWLRTKGLEIK